MVGERIERRNGGGWLLIVIIQTYRAVYFSQRELPPAGLFPV